MATALDFWTHVDVSSWFSRLRESVIQLWHWAEAILIQLKLGLIATYHQIILALTSASTSLTSPALWQPIIYWLLLLVMLLGVAGSFIPALPGITLVLGAIIVWGLIKGFAGLAWALGVAIAALIFSIAIDYLAGIIGAQRVGASRWGQIGAVVGMLLGLFGLLPALPFGGPIFGIIFGTVLGAFVGEFLHRGELDLPKRIQQSFKVGIAIVVGNLVGNLLQGMLALLATVFFIVTTWSSVFGA